LHTSLEGKELPQGGKDESNATSAPAAAPWEVGPHLRDVGMEEREEAYRLLHVGL